MTKSTRTLATLAAAGTLIAAPAVAQGAHKDSHKNGKPDSVQGKAKGCSKVKKVGFSVGGTLVSYTADNPATPANESSVTLKVTSANSNARQSGELADTDATMPGTQVENGTYTVAGEAVKLDGFEGSDTPSPGDKVKVKAKITRTKKKCAPAGTPTADLYGAVDVKKVTISDRDEDTPAVPAAPAQS